MPGLLIVDTSLQFGVWIPAPRALILLSESIADKMHIRSRILRCSIQSRIHGGQALHGGPRKLEDMGSLSFQRPFPN